MDQSRSAALFGLSANSDVLFKAQVPAPHLCRTRRVRRERRTGGGGRRDDASAKRATAATKAAALASSRPGSFDSDLELLRIQRRRGKAAAGRSSRCVPREPSGRPPEPRGAARADDAGIPPGIVARFATAAPARDARAPPRGRRRPRSASRVDGRRTVIVTAAPRAHLPRPPHPPAQAERGNAAANDSLSGGETSSDRAHGCSVGTTLSGDDDLAEDASCSTRAAGASPSRGDASPGFSSDLDGSGAPGDDWETAARDRAASSRLAETTGLPSRSPLGRGAADRCPATGPPDNAVANPGPGLRTRAPRTLRRRQAQRTDRCASLSRPARLKTQRVERPASASAGASETARAHPPARTTATSRREPAADPRPPRRRRRTPRRAAAAGGSGSEGGGIAGDALDTATALKGVLEGLALDGSCGGDDVADVPDGALAAPLLRHQRRAVSWMRRREAAGSSPRGGLLADDQGLGKTFSAIALIVSNPPPPRWFAAARAGAEDRPAGGTLVVCPTSVLRQWQRELASKVSSSAGEGARASWRRSHQVVRRTGEVRRRAHHLCRGWSGGDCALAEPGERNRADGNGNGAAAATGSSDDDDACEVIEPARLPARAGAAPSGAWSGSASCSTRPRA